MTKDQHTQIKSSLQTAKTKNQKNCNGIVGRCNDEVLQILLARIYEKPVLRNFISFVQTLNFYYSTRLQTANGKRNNTIIKAATLIKSNWKRKINLSKVSIREVDVQKVEEFRIVVKKTLGNDYYSFSTKVFHQLNNQYPIVDTNVKKFMKRHGYSKGKNYSSVSRSYKEFYGDFAEMMKLLRWLPKRVETLDIAIWELVMSHRNYYS